MNVEVCKECGDAYDPIEMVDGTCWKCMQDEDPLRSINFDELYDEVDKDVMAA
jgi:hypothetical protein